MKSREEALNELRNNAAFKLVLSKASSDSERRAIKAYTEDFFVKFYKQLYDPMVHAAAKDPDFIKNSCIKMDEGLITSGSVEILSERDGRPEKPRT